MYVRYYCVLSAKNDEFVGKSERTTTYDIYIKVGAVLVAYHKTILVVVCSLCGAIVY